MAANETSRERVWRWLRMLVGVVTVVALSPVIGMVLAFAVLPALPIVLAIGFVLGPVNWFVDLEEAEEEAVESGAAHAHARHRLAHA